MRESGVPSPFRRALCVYPYRRELRSAGFLPPIGLEYIATVVRPFAQSLDLVDLRVERRRTVDFLRGDTDLVCFSVNWDLDREFVREEIRSVPRSPGRLVVLGGRHVTEDPKAWLADFPNVDVVVRGDGEEAMEELCRGVPLERIAGISFRKDGEIRHGPNRVLGPLRNDLIPDRSLRRQDYGVRIRGAWAGIPMDVVSSSRGCPFHCTFCSFSRNPWGTKRGWSARSPESVVDEISRIRSPLVGFSDDLFTHDMGRVERICELLVERGIRKRFVANARLEVARRPDVLRKMERAGFSLLALGIESAHDKTLEAMRKGFDVARIREYFRVLRRSRMMLVGYFMIGNLGESVADMERIGPFARELGLDVIALSTLRASPWSGLDELVADTPGYHIHPDGRVYSDHSSARQLGGIRRLITRRFYSAGQYGRIIRKAALNDFARFLPAVFAHLPGVLYAVGAHPFLKRS